MPGVTRGSTMRGIALVLLGVACAAIYLVKGAGFVLDDWFYLRNATFDGALHAAGDSGGDRPVGALVYIAFFGVIGPHPAPIILVLGLAKGLSAFLLRALLSRWIPGRLATSAAVLWLVLPLTTSLEAWMATGTAVLAQLIALGGLLVLARTPLAPMTVALVGVMLALATLSYESVVVLALPVALAVVISRLRRIDLPLLGVLSIAPLAALAWAYTHRLEGRRSQPGLRNPLPAIDANFGRGIAPTQLLAALVLTCAVVGTIWVASVALKRPAGSRWTPPVAAVVVGWVIVWWGVVPYLTYFYSPYGAGDRLNLLSAFGAALVWAGLLAAVPGRGVQIGLAAVLLVVGVAARLQATERWSRAGLDGQRVAEAVVAAHPRPDRPLVVGPRVLVGNVSAFYDHSNIRAALQLAYERRDVEAYLAYDASELERIDRSRFIVFDQRPVTTLDELDSIIDGDGITGADGR